MIGQQIRKLRLCRHFVGIIVVFQSPHIHSHGNSFFIIAHNSGASCRIIRQFQGYCAILRLYRIFYAVYVHSRVIIPFRNLQGDLRGRHRSGCGCRSWSRRRSRRCSRCRGYGRCRRRHRCRIRLSRHIFIDRNSEYEGIPQRICRTVQSEYTGCLGSRRRDILHILVLVQSVSTVLIYIKLLQIQGILPLINVFVCEEICTSQNGKIRSLPFIRFRVFQSVPDDFLGALAICSHIKIVVIAFISLHGTGDNGRSSFSLLLQDSCSQMEGTYLSTILFSDHIENVFKSHICSGGICTAVHECIIQKTFQCCLRMISLIVS